MPSCLSTAARDDSICIVELRFRRDSQSRKVATGLTQSWRSVWADVTRRLARRHVELPSADGNQNFRRHRPALDHFVLLDRSGSFGSVFLYRVLRYVRYPSNHDIADLALVNQAEKFLRRQAKPASSL